MLSRTAGTVRLSSLTARTFASGLATQEAEPSPLQRLTDHVLVLKDFTTVLELAHDERQGLLAQLRGDPRRSLRQILGHGQGAALGGPCKPWPA